MSEQTYANKNRDPLISILLSPNSLNSLSQPMKNTNKQVAAPKKSITLEKKDTVQKASPTSRDKMPIELPTKRDTPVDDNRTESKDTILRGKNLLDIWIRYLRAGDDKGEEYPGVLSLL